MEMNTIFGFLENKAILITGGAGFLAKIFAEKVLRSQPNVKRIYLLLRAPDHKTASLRLQNEVGKDLFKVLKQKMGGNFNKFMAEKVKVVAGDISCKEDLGIKDTQLRDELFRDIHVIVNLAATINFDERYDVSLDLNTLGARYTLDFAKKCPNLKVFVQVSTAYVSGETVGIIKESPYYMGDTLNGRKGLDIEVEKKLSEAKLRELQNESASPETIKLAMKDMGIERARHWGWPNVYVFTKALGEMILMHEKGDIPLVIVRPTMVSSTYKEPFPGWVEGIRTIDSLAVAYGKGRLPCFVGDPESVADVIPADMVVNAMIVAMEAQANEKVGETMIYHVGSSVKNPVKFAALHEYGYEFFKKNPLINKNGEPIIVSHVKVLGSMDSFTRYLTLHYVIPLKGLEIANTAFCKYFQVTYTDMSRKINLVMRLIDLYKPYLFFKGFYDDLNTERLRIEARARGVDTDVFYFDPKVFDWHDYFLKIHLPGIVKYVFK